MALECYALSDLGQSKLYVQLDSVVHSKVFGFFTHWKPAESLPSETGGQKIGLVVVDS